MHSRLVGPLRAVRAQIPLQYFAASAPYDFPGCVGPNIRSPRVGNPAVTPLPLDFEYTFD